MDSISIDDNLCARDGICASVCPLGCLTMTEDKRPQLLPEPVCIGCGHCVAVCPKGAIKHSRLATDEFHAVSNNLPQPESLRGLMLSRRSVRVYKDKPVSKDTMSELLDTARFAPTAVNTQHVSYLACIDPVKVRQLAGLCRDWLGGSGIYPHLVEAYDQGREVMLRGAPAVVLAHCPSDYAWGETDSVIALSYLELAAAASGLGTCWAGLLTRAAQLSPAVSDFLNLPEGQKVHGGLMLGYSKYRYQLVPPRNPTKIIWV